jgi:hypothetical protein
MIFGNHVREELLDEEIMRNGVHVESEVDVAFGAVENRLATSDTGVVDQDGWVTKAGLDGVACGDDIGSRRKIAFEVADRWRACLTMDQLEFGS